VLDNNYYHQLLNFAQWTLIFEDNPDNSPFPDQFYWEEEIAEDSGIFMLHADMALAFDMVNHLEPSNGAVNCTLFPTTGQEECPPSRLRARAELYRDNNLLWVQSFKTAFLKIVNNGCDGVSVCTVVPPPVVSSPTTKAPVTNAPVTKAPMTKAPMTKAPVTKAPVTKAPTKVPTKAPKAPTKTPTKAPTKAPTTKAPTRAPVSAAVTDFQLINADTDKVIMNLANNAIISRNVLGTKRFNVVALTNQNQSKIGSVRFALTTVSGTTTTTNTNFKTEAATPFCLAGDNNFAGGKLDYYPWTAAIGKHTVTATPFPQANAGGAAGIAKSVTFSVTA
jgi:hypothetical protein